MVNVKTMSLLIGAAIGAIFASGITSAIFLSKKEKIDNKSIGDIIIFPDDFENDQLFLQLTCSLDQLKTKKHAFFKIIYDKDNKYVKKSENYAKS